MDKISVADARQGRGHRQAGPAARLGPHPPRFQGRLQLPRTQRRLLLGQRAGRRRRRRCPTTRARSRSCTAGCSVTVDGRGQGVAGQGPGDRGPRRRASPSTAGPTRRPIRCRRRATPSSSCAPSPTCGRGPTPSAPSPACATASAESIHDFFQEQGFLYVHTPIITASDCEGAGADVPRDDARPRTSCRASDGERRFHARTSSASRPT